MTQETFNEIIKELKPVDSTIEQVGLEYSDSNYEVIVYANKDDNYKMVIDSFCYCKTWAGWFDVEPTQDQLTILEDMIAKEVLRQQKIEDEKEKTITDADDWDVAKEQDLYN